MQKLIAAIVLSSALTATGVRAADEGPPQPPTATAPAPRVQIDMPPAAAGAGGNQATVTYDAPLMVRAFGTAVANGKTEKAAWLGISTSPAPMALLKQLKIKTGLVVDTVMPGSPAEAAGLKSLDVIEKLDDQVLINASQLSALVRLHNPGETITVTILHEGDRVTKKATLVEHEVLATVDTDNPSIFEGFDKQPAIAGMAGGLGGNGTPIVIAGGKSITVYKDDATNSKDPKGGALIITGPVTAFESQFSDGKNQLTIVRKGDQHVLTIKDSEGKQVFEGPVDTTEQQEKIPKELLPKFREMQKMGDMTDSVAKP